MGTNRINGHHNGNGKAPKPFHLGGTAGHDGANAGPPHQPPSDPPPSGCLCERAQALRDVLVDVNREIEEAVDSGELVRFALINYEMLMDRIDGGNLAGDERGLPILHGKELFFERFPFSDHADLEPDVLRARMLVHVKGELERVSGLMRDAAELLGEATL